jgi:hypothetical protein
MTKTIRVFADSDVGISSIISDRGAADILYDATLTKLFISDQSHFEQIRVQQG